MLVSLRFLCSLTDGHSTVTEHYCLSYAECLSEKKEQENLFNWTVRQILID